MNFEAIDKKETLAEKVANTIKEAILEGEIRGGENLPTEPELAAQFKVSRAVIRDASRMLMAWGLIEIRHGKGMYVTTEMSSHFLEALSTILRRAGANTWEMQEYEQLILPEIFKRAAANCTEEQKREIDARGREYIDFILTGEDNALRHKELYLHFIRSILQATDNKVLSLMGHIQQILRQLRSITDDEDRKEDLIAREVGSVRAMMDAIKAGDSHRAAQIMAEILKIGPKVEKIMRSVPLGQPIYIPADVFFEETSVIK